MRFLELGEDTAHLLKLLPLILEFAEHQPMSSEFRTAVSDVLSRTNCSVFELDLKIIIVINACLLEPMYRAAVDVNITITSYKTFVMKIMSLLQMDAAELLEILLLMHDVPFVGQDLKYCPTKSKK